MTICNMSIEGGARVGYVNPDETTFDYLRGRRFAPAGRRLRQGVPRGGAAWRPIRTRRYDDEVEIDAAAIGPTVTWGINPGSRSTSTSRCRARRRAAADRARGIAEALDFMGFAAGRRLRGTRIDVAFIGSCTNGRLSDLREAAQVVAGHHVAPHVRALVVPGSQPVRLAAEREGLDRVFIEAGFEWRGAGCSMCLAMNPDKLEGREVCASSSNRNFKGRQGSPTGRTLLMSPAMVAAAAVAGEVVDVREFVRWRLRQIHARIARPGAAAARQRHRHRSDHPGAVSAVDHVRGARAAPVRRRSQAARAAGRDASVRRSRVHGRGHPARERAISAAAPRASTRRRRSAAGAFARSSASRSPKSSSATRSRSGMPCVTASTPTTRSKR